MALSAKIVLPSVCVLTALTTVGGIFTVDYLKNEYFYSLDIDTELEEELKQKNSNRKYLIVKALNVLDIPKNLLLSSNKIDYVCKIDTHIIDSCKIYKLNKVSDKKQNVLLNKKADISNNAVFVVSFNESEGLLNPNDLISVYSSDETQKYFDLKIRKEGFEEEMFYGFRSSMIIAKIKNVFNKSSSDKQPYKCTLGENNTCEIYKLNDQIPFWKTPLPVIFESTWNKDTVTDDFDLLKNDYVLIDSIESNLYAFDWENSKKEIYFTDEKTKFFDFEIIATVVDFDDKESLKIFIEEDDQDLSVDNSSKTKDNKNQKNAKSSKTTIRAKFIDYWHEKSLNRNRYLIVKAENLNQENPNKYIQNDSFPANKKDFWCNFWREWSRINFDMDCELFNLDKNKNNELVVDFKPNDKNNQNKKLKNFPEIGNYYILKAAHNPWTYAQKINNLKIKVKDFKDNTEFISLKPIIQFGENPEKLKINLKISEIN